MLAAAQAGQDWAVAVIYHAYHPMLLRYLRWQEPNEADDLAGELWLAVARRLGSFSGDEGALRGWLFSIAHRRVADHRRRGARRRTYPMPIEHFVARQGGIDPADTRAGLVAPDVAVARLTAGLPRDQAEIIALRVLGGLGVDEVAELLGKRPGAVRVAQHRALKRLAATLTPEDVRQVFET